MRNNTHQIGYCNNLKNPIMKNVRLFIFTLIFSGALVSCTTTGQSISPYSSDPRLEQSSSDLRASTSDGSSSTQESIKRKILFSAFLNLTVEVPDTANSHIQKIAEKYNGYVNEVGTYRTIIRVKSENFNDAINEITELGTLQNKSLSGQDVTEEYLDYRIRLENAEKSRDRYLELLAKAENVEAALKVERELERLNGTIDMLKGRMNRIDHLSEFSTITINLKEKQEVKKPGPIGYIGIGLYRAVKWLFVRN